MTFFHIFDRYFIKSLLKTFFLLISTFYGLYILIDYTSHTSVFFHHNPDLSWTNIFLYYAAEFSMHMDILIPFALLIALIRTLSQLNAHNELVALMVAGVSKKRLLAPFIVTAFFFTSLLYCNNQFLVPLSSKAISTISEGFSKKRHKDNLYQLAEHLILEDGSTLIYHHFDDYLRRFYDVYWIRNVDELYRMRQLDVADENPLGKSIDHIVRDKKGYLTVQKAREKMLFPSIRFNKDFFESALTPESQSLTTLFAKAFNARSKNSEKDSQLLTAFYLKMALPWLAVFALLGPAPILMRFSLSVPTFAIYAVSIFALIGFCLMIDAAAVLSKRQLLAPALAIALPFGLVMSALLCTFWKKV